MTRPLLILFVLAQIGYSQPSDRQLVYSAALQTADFLTTLYALDRGLTEGNPIMRPIVDNIPLFLLVKIAVYYCTTTLDDRRLKWVNRLYLAVVLNNIYQVQRL